MKIKTALWAQNSNNTKIMDGGSNQPVLLKLY